MHVSYEDCIADSINSSPNLHPHYCDQCPYATFLSGFLDRHRLSSHPDNGYPVVPSSRPDRFDCSHCQYSFSTERHLVLHTRLKHKKTLVGLEPYRMHSPRDDKAYYALHQPIHGGGQFPQRSSQTTPTPVQPEGNAPPDESTTPRQTQESSTDLSATQLATSPTNRSLKPRNYVCSLCPYRATQKSALNVHFRRHTGEKPYACRSCDYKCAALNSLVVHNRIHTGEKPYKCQVCEKAFTQAGSLKAHHRVHKIT